MDSLCVSWQTYILHGTQVKVDGPVRPLNGPVMGPCPNGPIFRSLNLSTYHGLETRNGPIIFIIIRARYNEPITGPFGPVNFYLCKRGEAVNWD